MICEFSTDWVFARDWEFAWGWELEFVALRNWERIQYRGSFGEKFRMALRRCQRLAARWFDMTRGNLRQRETTRGEVTMIE
jgi:hypothetical protein